MATLRRFIACRGCPCKIYSDNGTNFVGARRKLDKLYNFLQSQDTIESFGHFFTNRRIHWSHIPSRAPHFGGPWEATVKAAKTHLHKVLATQRLTYEEYATILAEVEAILNSRPIYPLSSQPEDGVDVLTPAHLLVGCALKSLPRPPTSVIQQLTSTKRWDHCKKIAADFWTRWSKEYLSLLQRRQKWRAALRDIRVGDLVLIKDQTLFVHFWPMARVIQVHPGKDGHVRVDTLHTPKGEFTRPVVKLVLLLPEEEDYPLSCTSHSHPPVDVQAPSLYRLMDSNGLSFAYHLLFVPSWKPTLPISSLITVYC